MTLTSTAFANGAPIPREYTCDGAGMIPPLRWAGVPSGAQTLRIEVRDPDAPVPGGFTHWDVEFAPTALSVPPVPATAREATKWRPPCPPPGKVHHYNFTLRATAEGKDRAVATLATASLVGTYSR